MLTKAELCFNRHYLRILVKLGFLPIKFCKATGEFQVLSGHEGLRWFVLALTSQISLAYSVALLVFRDYQMDFANFVRKFVLESVFVYGFELTLFMGLWTFIRFPMVSETLCNESFVSDKTDVKTIMGSNERRRKFRDYSLLELVTINYPFVYVPWTIAFVAVTLRATTLGGTSVNSTSLTCIKAVAEFVTFFTCASSISWIVLNHILFIDRICDTLDKQIGRLR